MKRPRLYLSHDAEYDWLIAVAFGAVDDQLSEEERRILSEQFCYVLDRSGGDPIGFTILDFSEFDIEDRELAEIWQEPRFDAPVLGLTNVSAGEIATAARTYFGGVSSLNRTYFGQATNLTGEEAVDAWRACLESGDSMAHYALGYTLVELGRHREAYPHLRAYADLVPSTAWAWCWLGKACTGMGELVEARRAFERALALEAEGADETDAEELLAQLVSR